MSTDTLALILGFAALVLLSGMFSGGETALFALDRFQLRRFERSGSPRKRRVATVMHDPERLLAGILLGNTVVNVAGSSVMLGICTRLEAHLLGQDPVTASVVFATGLILILGEIIPKGVAVNLPERLAPVAVIPLSGFVRATAPLVHVIERAAFGLLRLIGVRRSSELSGLERRELQILFEDTRQGDELTEGEGVIAANIFTFFETRAYEVMTPRVDIVAVPVDLPREELLRRALEAKRSRLPVYRDSLDQVLGFINTKEFLLEPTLSIQALLRPVHYVPERARLQRVLAAVQGGRANLVLVVNEYGGTAGIITKEDLLEELVGEIFDENESEEIPDLEPQPDGSFSVSGLLLVEDLGARLGLDLTDGPAETVGGHVAHLLGRPPRMHDRAEDEHLNYAVTAVRRHRAERVRVSLRDRGVDVP